MKKGKSYANKSKSIIDPNIDKLDEENGDHRKEDDFLFGSISAAKYQEFVVTKINKRGKRQTRVLAIDGFNFYNIRKDKVKDSSSVLPEKEKKRNSFFSGFLQKKIMGVKRKARPINTIEEIRKLDLKTIQITFQDKST